MTLMPTSSNLVVLVQKFSISYLVQSSLRNCTRSLDKCARDALVDTEEKRIWWYQSWGQVVFVFAL
ncbi:hypothetical protein AZE42_11129 [Rhizopogon vesiculosus]|uniref:Uncharacterized protein n=1 Tax=Rhizopogon vesiculosus TaxID=180088 RepID=A0A1J8R5V2_9AGAM|nr:hypothetical protein AZE42_11129 [Rhizopogon vesiculosus]